MSIRLIGVDCATEATRTGLALGTFDDDELQVIERAYIERIDQMGGAVAAIERGFQQREIADAAYRAQLAIEEKRDLVVGVNAFAAEEELPIEVLQIEPEIERDQVARLQALRGRRDRDRAEGTLVALGAAAQGDQNLMPPILDCVRAEVTLGEISDALRGVFGEYREADLE